MTTVLIDGDIFAYESASAAERKFEFGEEVTRWCDEPLAYGNLDARVASVMKAAGAKAAIIALSDPDRRYWRHDLMPNYKGHRNGGTKPSALGKVREYIERGYRTYVRPLLEADDILGILMTHPTLVAGKKVIVTSDKDLKQIPGLHLNHAKLAKGVVPVSPDEGDHWHLYQTLVGDRVDGFPGCPGVGPVKAGRILSNPVWESVVAAYVKAGKTEADALLQARVARILRADDWDFEKKEPRLWQPK